MKVVPVLLVVLSLAIPPAWAAPGDPLALQGALAWPSNLGPEPFMVVRVPDGRVWYVDISSAQRRGTGPLTAGTPVSVLGVEGLRPHEVAAVAFGPGDAALGSLPVPAPPPGPAAGPAAAPSGAAPGALPRAVSEAPPPGEPAWQRLRGTVETLSGRTLVLRAPQGRVTVDLSRVGTNLGDVLRPGQEVTVFGHAAEGGFTAVGFVSAEPASGGRPVRR